jgi:hypothetical protein
VNESRHHTDQADSNETLDSLEQKLSQVPVRSSIQLTPAEARARALAQLDAAAGRCGDCPCEGMGAIAAVALMGLGSVTGVAITLLIVKVLP